MFSRRGAWSPISIVVKTFDSDQVQVLGDLHGTLSVNCQGRDPERGVERTSRGRTELATPHNTFLKFSDQA